MTTMTTALYVGRFQPFHRGHLSIIKEALSVHDSLIIVVGSAQEYHTAINPFSIKERIQMITASLSEEQLSKITITPVDDTNDNSSWVRHVLRHVPRKIDRVYSGQNKLTYDLFSQAGFNVCTSPQFEGISSTEIRRRIKYGEHWFMMVPDAVSEYLKKHGLLEELRK